MLKIIIASLFLVGCSTLLPKYVPFEEDIPGSPEWKLGWKHGCESGYVTYGHVIYRVIYKFYQDYKMLSNQDYNVAWHEGYNTCRHYMLKLSTADIWKGAPFDGLGIY